MVNDNSILLVEDNPDDIELTERAIKRNGVINDIVVAHDGVEALDYLYSRGNYAGRLPPTPAVVLLDLKLPKVSGLEVLKEIRSRKATSLVPVVVLTSSREEQDLLKSYQAGANSYVQKPVDFIQFTDAVRQMGLYWLLLNEKPPVLPNK